MTCFEDLESTMTSSITRKSREDNFWEKISVGYTTLEVRTTIDEDKYPVAKWNENLKFQKQMFLFSRVVLKCLNNTTTFVSSNKSEVCQGYGMDNSNLMRRFHFFFVWRGCVTLFFFLERSFFYLGTINNEIIHITKT